MTKPKNNRNGRGPVQLFSSSLQIALQQSTEPDISSGLEALRAAYPNNAAWNHWYRAEHERVLYRAIRLVSALALILLFFGIPTFVGAWTYAGVDVHTPTPKIGPAIFFAALYTAFFRRSMFVAHVGITAPGIVPTYEVYLYHLAQIVGEVFPANAEQGGSSSGRNRT